MSTTGHFCARCRLIRPPKQGGLIHPSCSPLRRATIGYIPAMPERWRPSFWRSAIASTSTSRPKAALLAQPITRRLLSTSRWVSLFFAKPSRPKWRRDQGHALRVRQPLIEIGDDVVLILDADRESDDVRACASLHLLRVALL